MFKNLGGKMSESDVNDGGCGSGCGGGGAGSVVTDDAVSVILNNEKNVVVKDFLTVPGEIDDALDSAGESDDPG